MPYLKGQAQKADHCVFCHKVDADDDDEYVVFRSEWVYVTLNLYPYTNGHLLVVPYTHVADITDLDATTLLDLMQTAQKAIVTLQHVYHPQGFNTGINMGQAGGAGIAEHLHMHLVPRWVGDTNFLTVTGQTRVIPDLLENTYQRLREAWPLCNT